MNKENKQVIDTILRSIDIMNQNSINKAPFDVTRWAVVTYVNTDGTYNITMDGRNYTNIPSSKPTSIPVDTTVEIKVPNNQYNRMYIDYKVEGGKAEGDKTYIHNQNNYSSKWYVNHGLNKYPSITIVDFWDNEILGDVLYRSLNSVEIEFTQGIRGRVFCN